MKRLRHPVRAVREPFGTAGLIVACVALILALTGAAFAATGLNGKQKKEVEKIAKKFAGKPGTPGANGPAGPQGPAGAKGATGAAGANGTNGTNGESVTVKSYKGPKCSTEEGAELKNASGTAFVCNGEEGLPGIDGATGPTGATGPKGSPWTFGGTLPPGATETGSWAFNGTTDDTQGILTPISFPIRLNQVVVGSKVHIGVQGEPGFADSCPGTTFNPAAVPGELCVYINEVEGLENASFDGVYRYNTLTEGTGRAGALLKFTPSGVAYGAGSFAVTGCDPTLGATEFACP